MVFGKKVHNGCSDRRPDIRIECLAHTIVVECDEDQHKQSAYLNDSERTEEIFQDLGSRPLVMLRFNPDSYTEDGRRLQGCFSTTESGAFLPDGREWNWRLKELARAIRLYLKNIPEEEITVKYLFYDS